MARRRFQAPKVQRKGHYWWISPWVDEFKDGRPTRVRKRMKVAEATVGEREAQKIAAEMLRPMNQGLESIGSATPFRTYVEGDYRGAVLPQLASTTQVSYESMLDKYLLPVFGEFSLREMTPMLLQKYFNGLACGHASKAKVKDALSSVLGSAVTYGLLIKNPLAVVKLGKPRRKPAKPYISPEQFDLLVNLIPEPYATAVYVCLLAGLRVSELVGLKWEDVHADSLTIDERFCRGDWNRPKTEASNATIAVDKSVIERIHNLKKLETTIRWGANGAKKKIKLVRASGPEDLVFQSVRTGAPLSDHNVLSRHIKPAARKLGIGFANWQVLRRSYATWMAEMGASPKALQGQMRHSRISTTMEVYAQHVPEAQKRAVTQLSAMVEQRIATARKTGGLAN